MNILNTTTALARRHQRVFFGSFIHPTEPAKWQFLIYPIDHILLLIFLIGFLLLITGTVPLIGRIHPRYHLLIDSSGTAHQALADRAMYLLLGLLWLSKFKQLRLLPCTFA
jgi:hypothetical protein